MEGSAPPEGSRLRAARDGGFVPFVRRRWYDESDSRLNSCGSRHGSFDDSQVSIDLGPCRERGPADAICRRPSQRTVVYNRLFPTSYLSRMATMTDLFPPWSLFSAFLVASFALAVTPGPGVLYIVTRSLVQGRSSGLMSVAGVALGNLGNALAASVGLAALFAVSSFAFSAVKYAGALYLIYLGVQMLRRSPVDAPVSVPAAAPHGRIFRDGFVVALLNPKTTVFFAAFLPQFLNPVAPAMSQSFALGSIFVAIAGITDSAYAVAASVVAPRLRGSGVRRLGRRLGGGVFIGLGVFTALAGSRAAK